MTTAGNTTSALVVVMMIARCYAFVDAASHFANTVTTVTASHFDPKLTALGAPLGGMVSAGGRWACDKLYGRK